MVQKLQEIRSHIANIRDIKQITKAMHAISITRVTTTSRQLKSFRKYSDRADEMLEDILKRKRREKLTHSLIEGNDIRKEVVFVVNSDRGLCGRFKGDINKAAMDLIKSREKDMTVITGGEKARTYFENRDVEIVKSYVDFYSEPEYGQAVEVGDYLLDIYRREVVGKVWVVYMRFISNLDQRITVNRILPISREERGVKGDNEPDEKGVSDSIYHIYEPSLGSVIQEFLPFYLKTYLYRIILESKTSEHAIRRRSMKNATDNADELIDDLTLSFNKARQREITREIADIMGGAEALKEKYG